MKIRQVFYSDEKSKKQALFKYCPFCKTSLALQERGGLQRPSCPNCGFAQYRNPFPGVVVLVEKAGRILLGKRRSGFGRGKWGLPQGYIEFGETFLDAAVRETKEETGLDVSIQSIINVVSNMLSPDLNTIAIILTASVRGGEERAGDDLEELAWIPLSDSPPPMAFEADEWIIQWYRDEKDATIQIDSDFAERGTSFD